VPPLLPNTKYSAKLTVFYFLSRPQQIECGVDSLLGLVFSFGERRE
jgi:hypothetical protein